MTDLNENIAPDPADEGLPDQYEYIEEVVEYKDTRLVRTLLAVVLALLALMLAFFAYRIYSAQRGQGASAARGTKGMTWVRSIYGWGNGLNDQLITPNTVAIGPDGLIWTNTNNRAAVAFNADGSFDRILQSKPQAATDASKSPEAEPARSEEPTVDAVFSLDVDGNNNLYICDNANGNIMEFSPEGALRQGWSVPGVNKIAVNDSRVAAMGVGAIGVFGSANREPYFQYGTRGQGEQQFDNPFGVHIDDQNYVYVADTLNRRVRKLDPRGNLVWETGTPPKPKKSTNAMETSSTGVFQLPTGVTTDANGRVVVTDAFNYQIIVLDGKTGRKLKSYGDFGPADGQFNNPSAIAYDPKRDYFVVADTDNNRLQVIRIEGSSKAPARAALRRLFDQPVWICFLPFLILLIAALVVLVTRRRRADEDAAPEGSAPAPAA